ncbi:MAG TPA: hypothetical protein VJB67_00950 [Patescibacteria group bacterium]|nr:hypothetical protein [Patescibacteria group bacterium]
MKTKTKVITDRKVRIKRVSTMAGLLVGASVVIGTILTWMFASG